MNNFEIYMKVVSYDNLEKIFREEHVHESLKIVDFAIATQDDFPFVLVKIDTDAAHAAKMIGLSLKIDKVIADYTEPYYFPIVAMSKEYSHEISKFIDVEMSLKHELLHVKDVISIVETDPSYPVRLAAYSFFRINDIKHLPQSIDLEVFKIFRLEPQAFRSDYSHGEKTIRTKLLGQVLEYECKSQQEYVEMKIMDYLDNLSGDYGKKFPKQKRIIERNMDKCIAKYGTQVLGPSPLMTLRNIRKVYPEKILAKIIESMKSNNAAM